MYPVQKTTKPSVLFKSYWGMRILPRRNRAERDGQERERRAPQECDWGGASKLSGCFDGSEWVGGGKSFGCGWMNRARIRLSGFVEGIKSATFGNSRQRLDFLKRRNKKPGHALMPGLFGVREAGIQVRFLRMAAPISAVLTLVSPSAPVKRSPVRRPESMAAWAAASMASAAAVSPRE